MSSAALQPSSTHHRTLRAEEPSTDVSSCIHGFLMKTENPEQSDAANGGIGQSSSPTQRGSHESSKGQVRDCGTNLRRAPLRNASSRARIGVSKAYAPLLVPAPIESDIAPPSQILDNSDTEMLLNIDDLIDNIDSSDDSDGYTEARAAAASRRSRSGMLGKRKNMRAQESRESNAVGKRSRKEERLDREDLMLIRGKDTVRKQAARKRRLCVLSEEERGGLDGKGVEKLVEFVAETIDWKGALRKMRAADNETTSNDPLKEDVEDLSISVEALSKHWREVLSKKLVEMYPA